jgi:flagellar biosynthesis/type III secretory pathway protein FliH
MSTLCYAVSSRDF